MFHFQRSVLLLLLAAAALCAQTTASLRGTVTDPSGAGVPGASVTVTGPAGLVRVAETTQLELDPSKNAGQLVLSGQDLDMLSDDPDDLQNDLMALAGPAAGPNGA